MQPARLALSEPSLAAKWVFNSILFTVLQSRVLSWNVTQQHSWHCDITVCIFTLQLLNLNNFIHCKFILIEKYNFYITMQKQYCPIYTPSFDRGKVSCFSQKENLGLSTVISSTKNNFRKFNRKLIKIILSFLAIPMYTPATV